MFSFNVGKEHGVTQKDIQKMSRPARKAFVHLTKLICDPASRIKLKLDWTQLPYQDRTFIKRLQRRGDAIAREYENVISLGIGGSFLGIKASMDALCPAYYNEFTRVRRQRPRMFFEGNNLDPDTLSILLKGLDPRKTFIIVISKSGETTETKSAFIVVEDWLKKGVGKNYGRQIFIVTDPQSGSLRKKIVEEQKKDSLSFQNMPLHPGVGGRFSELNMGLLHLAILGIDVQQVLDGAAAMARRCSVPDLMKNPACMYAMLHTILYKKKGKPIAVVMPFSERLKSTADWYIQLLAESLGKKYARKILIGKDGIEEWVHDLKKIVNVGRTPVSARGTNDLHSIQQNNIEGENDKVVTLIRVEQFENEVRIPRKNGILSDQRFSQLINLALEGTAWALVRESRPNCTISLPRINPYYWGGLIFFYEMVTAYEGELLGVNTFDQPGVESYKNYMYYKLGKPGLSKEIANQIKDTPTVKKPRFIS